MNIGVKFFLYVFAFVAAIVVIKCALVKGEYLEDIFINGDRIVSSVSYVDEHVDFVGEGTDDDYWQTPQETLKLKTGDCEDVVLLFAYLNRNISLPAYYCWGDTMDTNGQIMTHAWVELTAKNRDIYVVEFFAPTPELSFVRMLNDKWDRVRHVIISHDAFCEMARDGFRRQSYVFSKLHETCSTK